MVFHNGTRFLKEGRLDILRRMIVFWSKINRKRRGGAMVWEVSPWRPFEFEKMRMEMDWLWDSFLEGRPGRRTREGEE